jgi:hypothetical protein
MWRKAALGFGLIVVFLFFPVLSQAQTVPYIVSAYAFHAMNDGAEFAMGGGVLWTLAGSLYGWFAAPVQLPNGAGITKFEVRARNNGAMSFEVSLWRKNIFNQAEQKMAEVTVTNTGNVWTTFTAPTVSYWTVNNSGYGYYVCIDFGSAIGPEYQFEGVKLQYLPPS